MENNYDKLVLSANENNIKILIAQDSIEQANRVKDYLQEQESLNILGITANGKEVVDWLVDHNVDIIITELSLPVLDGLQILKVNADLPDDKKKKFIFYTRLDDAWLIRKIIAAGAKAFVSRNSDIICLTKAIRIVQRGSSYIDDGSFHRLAKAQGMYQTEHHRI